MEGSGRSWRGVCLTVSPEAGKLSNIDMHSINTHHTHPYLFRCPKNLRKREREGEIERIDSDTVYGSLHVPAHVEGVSSGRREFRGLGGVHRNREPGIGNRELEMRLGIRREWGIELEVTTHAITVGHKYNCRKEKGRQG